MPDKKYKFNFKETNVHEINMLLQHYLTMAKISKLEADKNPGNDDLKDEHLGWNNKCTQLTENYMAYLGNKIIVNI